MYNICRTECYFNIIARAFKYSGYKIPQAPITVHTARTNCLRNRKMNSITPPSDRQAGNRATVGTFEWLAGWCSSSSGWLTSMSLELPLSAVSLVLQNLISLIQDQFTGEEKGSQTGVLFPAGCFIFVTMSRPAVNLPNLLTSIVESSLGA